MKPKVPPPPEVIPPPVLPDPESPEVLERKKQAEQAIYNRTGRASTILH